MFVVFCFILIIFIFIYFHIYISLKIKSNSILRKFRSEVDKTIIEINQATDRNINIIEIKIESLNRIIKEVDERIEILDQRLLGFNAHSISMGSNNFSMKGDSSVYKSNLDYSIPTIEKNIIKEGYNIRQQVISLYEQGMSLEVIAKKLKLDLGEIELIVSIHRGT
ncbi:hypothetical protein A7978_01310 [Borrelia turicatae]|uniref:DUF2802 domain-containing protein n=2 Tax=Borrelia turicatae TaxID=142 RepID=A0A172XB32_BORTU|nr:hypothetical protein BT0265 [Borrelia turicatae 91E135]ANF33759.1 hypothetical protein A7978_01310 [Borrelia turicatae]UPA11952.1 hypothetical protein bvRMA01_000263 [Borrelia venezuelensis]UPA13127.1 hypothetical protein bt91E135_000261 [Borrelia turicatae 91E135]UPA14612.1 hypothetical protein btBTE5EL_000261 [Borrelia turicatae]